MKNRLFISTLDLGAFQYGGVTAIALLFARVAREMGFAPTLLSPSLQLHRTVKRTLTGQIPPSRAETQFEGIPWIQFAAQFPEFEQNAHRFQWDALRSLINHPSPCFVVNGNNHAALPFHTLNVPYSMWIASTYWEDCRHRIESSPWSLRKVLDYASKPACEKQERILMENARRVATISRYTLDQCRKVAPACSSRSEVIPIPVDSDLYQPSFDSRQKNIVMVGRLSDPRKNVNLLLAAFELFKKKHPEYELILIGSGRETLEDRLNRHPFANSIRCPGPLKESEKIAALQNTTCVVIPSLQEGYGITGVEALSCGTPVISTPCGGPSDFVRNGENGFLLKTFEAAEMAESMHQLVSQTDLRNRMEKQAREICVTQFSHRALIPKLKHLIQSHIEGFSP